MRSESRVVSGERRNARRQARQCRRESPRAQATNVVHAARKGTPGVTAFCGTKTRTQCLPQNTHVRRSNNNVMVHGRALLREGGVWGSKYYTRAPAPTLPGMCKVQGTRHWERWRGRRQIPVNGMKIEQGREERQRGESRE